MAPSGTEALLAISCKIAFISVLLPQPDSPTIPRISPFSILKLTFRTMGTLL